MRQKVGEYFRDKYPLYTIFRETPARTDFNAARDQAITLIEIHDDCTGAKAGRPEPRLEALKRSALVLAVTAWESFVEDTVTEQLGLRVDGARAASEMQSVFNSVADEWLDPIRSPKRHGPDLVHWAGDGWKDLIRDSLKKSLETFHTPNSENTNQLFKRYLGITIRGHWSWQAVSSAKAAKQLDDLIRLRGRVVHRGKRFWPFSLQKPHIPYSRSEPDIRRSVVVKALNLVYNLVDSTEHALGISPTTDDSKA